MLSEKIQMQRNIWQKIPLTLSKITSLQNYSKKKSNEA